MMRGTMTRALIAIALAIAAAGCNKALLRDHAVALAGATIADSTGRTVATASLWQEANGLVHVDVEAQCTNWGCPLLPGEHGLHFHAVGSCVAPVFTTAGGHFNPLGKQHGLNNAAGPHAGDAPNITIGSNGRGKATFTTDRITLTAGPTSLFDSDGSAIVIHAGADDQMSQPSGNSGGRVACGVLKTVQ
jgi:Cu-Zn family superoxide dismutase